jgi:hypothetical protein
MNKKKLLLVLLALAIVTSLSAGTLAIYTKTVSTSEQVQAKRFAFASPGTTSVSTDGIQLAPGETATTASPSPTTMWTARALRPATPPKCRCSTRSPWIGPAR